ncbi:hypothetical protein ACRALDRAFT_1078581 [Sodiomyces alcalophilus JCM 7366]|uniref:uncharacterized protein n=1 Tax=Sodiomyces alcalophilus JCM 7366 TaxID=591952 RepID=UPI0039B44FCB
MESLQLSERNRSEYQSEFLQKNPPVAGPVSNLLDLQLRYYALNQQFQDAVWQLEQQHYARCQSLFQDRQAVVVSGHNDTALHSDVAGQQQGDGGSSSPVPARGIPFFWLRAMKNNPAIASWICESDEPALSYLRDVRTEFVDKEGITGFRIVFDFDKNPYFSNATLTKEFIYERDNPQDDIYGELLYAKAPGCAINWHPGHDLTEITITASEQVDGQSFFEFFQSSPDEDEENDDGEGDSDDSDAADSDDDEENSDDGSVEDISRGSNAGFEDDSDDEDEDWALDYEFELGEEFKDRLIPYAVHWYTGEALNFEDDDEDEDEDGDEDEDDDAE